MAAPAILVVEDDPGISGVLRLALELEGYGVHVGANGKEGLLVLASVPRPCLILLDLMMPVMDGWDFAEAVSRNPDWADIPVVVVSAFTDQAATVKNARDFLPKPVDIDALLRCVHASCGSPT